MIRLIGKIPNNFYLAISGGIDSMVAMDFFLKGKKTFTAINYNHDTKFGNESAKWLEQRCLELKVPLIVKKIEQKDTFKDTSLEAYWRNARYSFFHGLDKPVITVHHLNDVMEWWLFSSLHGVGKIIPYQNLNVIRPFLATSKRSIEYWAFKNNVRFLHDPGNQDEKYMRSIIRHKILPESLRVNPGLEKVLKKKIFIENNIPKT